MGEVVIQNGEDQRRCILARCFFIFSGEFKDRFLRESAFADTVQKLYSL